MIRVPLLPTLAAVAVIALTISLGNWQIRRGHEKAVLQERFDTLGKEPPVDLGGVLVDASVLDLRRVRARGRWLPEEMVLLDNRVHHGVPGYYVFMPLQLEGSKVNVLVNRGWVAALSERSHLPTITTPQGVVTVDGLSRAPRGKVFELAQDSSSGKVWQNISVERFHDAFKLDLQPIIVEQTSSAGDGLVREWERPDFGIDKHRGYAFQWYSLAALTAVLYAVLSLKGAKKQGG